MHDTAAVTSPLGELLAAAARGQFPPADGRVGVVPPVRPGLETVMAFTGHAVVATQLPADQVLARGPDGFGGAVAPEFLLWLAGSGGVIRTLDVVLVAAGRGDADLPVRRDLDDHPRVRRARSLRESVVVRGDERGLTTIGVGIGGLTEMSVEIDPHHDTPRAGRRLIADVVGTVPAGDVVVAEVAPGNARSLRAFLAAGFTPVGAAVHIAPQRGKHG